MAGRPTYRSASELAEYAYCPRSHYFRERYGAPEPSPATQDGTRFHLRELTAVRRRAEHRRGYWAALLLGASLLLLAAWGAGL